MDVHATRTEITELQRGILLDSFDKGMRSCEAEEAVASHVFDFMNNLLGFAGSKRKRQL